MQRWFIFFIATVLLLAGCTPVKVSNVATYRLGNTKTEKQPKKAKTVMTIALAMPTASPGFQTADMIYVMTPFELQSFSRNRWVAPPAQMLVPIMLESLRSKAYYRAVIPPPLLSSSNYRLSLQLFKLQQEFLLPTSQVRLEIQAILLDSRTHHIVASRYFAVLVPVSGSTPYAGVLAANRAALDVSRRIADWCVQNT